jgi:hypothetical protein
MFVKLVIRMKQNIQLGTLEVFTCRKFWFTGREEWLQVCLCVIVSVLPSLKQNLARRRAESGLGFVTPVRGRSGLDFAIK